MIDSLSQLVLVPIVLLVAIVIVMISASSTSIGQALLPDAVVDAVKKLMPRAVIMDAEAIA